ncbi:CHC2 zinc finger domain-containing protein [Flavobacterium oreochromis]|uniref:CHC2 zinc finger domain-containing protein n=1 Tax=Flavobacterium oreochromis TaxID=2906078 RepID=UPI00385ED77C
MQINDIKQTLSLSQVLQHYNLQPNKNKMLCCPFHQDKTASLQVNLEKDFYKCHACGAKGDQIQFVQDFESATGGQAFSKHEALKKCTELSNKLPVINKQPITTKPMDQEKRIEFLEKLYETFIKSVYLSQPARDYLQSRNLLSLVEKRGLVGFNSGQFHHAGRFENEANPEQAKKEMIQDALEVGMLTPLNRMNNQTGEAVTYQVFANKSIAFPLRNNKNQIVSYYLRSIDDKNGKHFYLKNRQGLYPNYPKPETKKLILTEAIIDCASLLHIPEITNNYSLLACYGTNGLTPEHLEAIKNLKELEEVIFFFDGDKAGSTAIAKYAKELLALIPPLGVRGLTRVETPENEDVNSLLVAYEKEIFMELLEKRKTVITKDKTILPENIISSVEPTLNFKPLNFEPKTKPLDFLKTPNLLHNTNDLLGKIGIVGEEDNRLLQYVTATTYKMNYNLHVLYQGSSGSGKTHTIKQIALLIPPEDVIYLTRVTESSLYNYKNGEFMYKLIVFEDLDGLKEEALLAVREMISNKKLSSSTSIKDKKGNADGKIKEVEVSFASLSATTKGELYEDNMSRIIVLSVDESKEQTKRIIEYKNKVYQGEINKQEQEQIRLFLRECIKLLQVYEVINPYANLVELPENVHKPTRMHDIVMGVINQIVLLNQYQRNKTPQGQLIAEKEDVINGLLLMKNSIILKMDELEGKVRTFYESLKKFAEKKAKKEDKKREDIKFTRFDIKDHYTLSKAQINRYLTDLVSCEYLSKIGKMGKGNQYKIAHWDNFKTLSEEQLQTMLGKLKE